LYLHHEGAPCYYLERVVILLEWQGLSLGEIMKGPVRSPGAVNVPFGNRWFLTSSSKFEFVSQIPQAAEHEHQAYRYHLISLHPKDRLHSQVPALVEYRLPEAGVAPRTVDGNHMAEEQDIVVETAQASRLYRENHRIGSS
jgi:hypothetical protein